MTFLVQVAGTVVGFVVVMAAASMLVTAMVRVVHYAAHTRGRTVMEMLASINQSFRVHHGDTAVPGDVPETTFVLDVLADPALHSQSGMESFWSAVAKAPGHVQGIAQGRDKLAKRVEHVLKDDLLRVVARHTKNDFLPATWHNNLGKLATYENFRSHVDAWFESAEGLSTERFRKDTKRLVAVLSSVVVVALNMDGFQLIDTLQHDPTLQNALAAWGPDLLQTSERLGSPDELPSDRDQLLSGLTQEFQQLNGILSEPRLSFGWQQSWIVQRWCAENADCVRETGMPAQTPPSDFLSTLRWLRWLTGLFFSYLMLSLGAPFWADRLREVLNTRNALASKVGKATEPPAKADS